MTLTNTKILVIGAGLAGPSICYWLKTFGFSPFLVERAQTLRTGGYAVDIRGIGIDVAKKMGIFKKTCDMRTTVSGCTHVDESGNAIHREEGEESGYRQGEEVEIVRGDLVEILMQMITDVPHEFGRTITNIVQDNDKVKVTFSDEKTEQFDLVIGADGMHSSTRHMAFSEDAHNIKNLGYYISVFSIPNYLDLNHDSVMFERDGKLAHVVSDKKPDTALAEFMFRSNHKISNIRDEAEKKAFLRQTYKNLGWDVNKLLELMEQSKDLYFDSISQIKMDSWTRGRVALVGDSGYCASPLSGQGTSLALVGAYILAGELKKSNGEHIQAFENYNKLMRPFVDANQSFGEWSSANFLKPDETDEEITKSRTKQIIEKLAVAANSIELPEY